MSRGTSLKPFYIMEHRSVWLEILHFAEPQLLMYKCRSHFQLCFQGFARQFSDYLYNSCVKPVFAILWSC